MKLNIGYVWFLKNLREDGKERKQREKGERNKKWRKIKNKFKINKLFLFTNSNLFHLF